MITSADQLAYLFSSGSARVYSDPNKPRSKFIEVTNTDKTKIFELHYDLKDKLTKVTRENGEKTLKQACSDFLGQSSCAKLRAYYSTHEKPVDTGSHIESQYTVTKPTCTETLTIDDQIADNLTKEELELISIPVDENSSCDQMMTAYKLAMGDGDFELAKKIIDGVVDSEFDFLNDKVNSSDNGLDNVASED